MKHWTAEKKNIWVHGIAAASSLALIVCAALAWFLNSRDLTAAGMSMGIAGNDGDTLAIYHILETDESGTVLREEKVDAIVIENYLPNQSESFRIAVGNNTAQEKTLSLLFENVTAAFAPDNPDITPDLLLSRMILAAGLRAENLGTPRLNAAMTGERGRSLYDLYGSDDTADRTIIVADSMTLGGGKSGSLYLTFTLSPDAGNYYQQKAIQIETVSLVSGS